MKSRWETYKGQKILFNDYSGIGGDVAALKAEQDYMVKEITSQPLDSVLCLAETQGLFGTPDMLEVLKAASKLTKPYVKKTAVLGVEGAKKILAKTITLFTGQSTQYFDTREKALEWLIKP
jgi:hypothetical protein